MDQPALSTTLKKLELRYKVINDKTHILNWSSNQWLKDFPKDFKRKNENLTQKQEFSANIVLQASISIKCDKILWSKKWLALILNQMLYTNVNLN